MTNYKAELLLKYCFKISYVTAQILLQLIVSYLGCRFCCFRNYLISMTENNNNKR